jgi:predicted NBD/HSP70 family sugar kinase
MRKTSIGVGERSLSKDKAVPPLCAGIDAGGNDTKAILCAADGWSLFYPSPDIQPIETPNLRRLAPESWPNEIIRWASSIGHPVSLWKSLGIALALPLIDGVASDRTRKFLGLDGRSIVKLQEDLHQALGIWVSILHDGAAALFGELAHDPLAVHGSTGILTFGNSIGFGWARDGEPLMTPYTSWVSHVQLCPGFPLFPATCQGCGRVGCWRSIYQFLKGDKDNPKIEFLPTLLEFTAQGIATVLNVLPMDNLFLSGGWTEHHLNPRAIQNEAVMGLKPFDSLRSFLKSRIVVEPSRIIRLAKGGQYSGAVGAAWYAYRQSLIIRPA